MLFLKSLYIFTYKYIYTKVRYLYFRESRAVINCLKSESIESLSELNDFYFFYFHFIHKKVQIKVHKKKPFSPVGTYLVRENAVSYMDRCKKKQKPILVGFE